MKKDHNNEYENEKHCYKKNSVSQTGCKRMKRDLKDSNENNNENNDDNENNKPTLINSRWSLFLPNT